MSKPLVIVGSGGFAREVLQIVRDLNDDGADWDFLGWLDDDTSKQGAIIAGHAVLGATDWLADNSNVACVVGIGNPPAIAKTAHKLDQWNIRQPTLIHPRAWIGKNVDVGRGSIICAGNSLTVDITIGRNAILNLNGTIGHDAKVGDYAVINPQVAVSGGVNIGTGALIGTGSTILQNIRIGDWSIVGGGAVVVKDLPSNVTAVGSPARPIKERQPGWHLQ